VNEKGDGSEFRGRFRQWVSLVLCGAMATGSLIVWAGRPAEFPKSVADGLSDHDAYVVDAEPGL
jgi:hypothetical protein